MKKILFLLHLWNIVWVFIWYRFLIGKLHFIVDKDNVSGLWGFFFAGVISTFFVQVVHDIYPLPFFIQSVYESDFLYNVLVTGIIEEFVKWTSFILIAHTINTVKEPQDGILQGAAVGLGFGFIENILYINWYPELYIAIRPILSTGGHMLYGAIWGGLYAAARWNNVRSRDPGSYRVAMLGFFAMAFFHGLYNSVVVYGLVFGLAVKFVLLFISFSLFLKLTKHSPYIKYPLRKAATAIPALKRGLFFNRKSPILNRRLGIYLMYRGDYKRALGHFYIAIPRTVNKENISFFAAVCEFDFLDNEKGKQQVKKAWGKLSDKAREKARKRLNLILVNDNALQQRVYKLINSPFSERRGKQGYTLARELKEKRMRKKYYNNPSLEQSVRSLSEEEKDRLRRIIK
ncbi:MAG: PrsW family intramembrane metalloprotease [Spirochaetia bacterium]|nr:PrsW family intramembrane metalloprotease [Spirochaetia bacterium]